MIDLRDLRLDTADRCHAALATLLTSNDQEQRLRVLTLLADAAPPALEAPLVAVASDPDADGWACSYALRALYHLGAAVPVTVYRRLLGEAAWALGLKRTVATDTNVSPVGVVLAATTPALVAQCLAWVEGLGSRSVPRLLWGLVCNRESGPTEVRDALIERWLYELPEAPESCDIDIATQLADTDEGALEVLCRHWRARVLCGDAGVVEAMRRVPALARRLSELPAVQGIVQAALLGPTGGLVDALGELTFARRLRNAVLRWNARTLPPADPYDGPEHSRYLRARDHLNAWARGGVIVADLLREAKLSTEVVTDLVSLWLRHDRSAALAWTEARVRDVIAPEERASLVDQVIRSPQPGDRSFLLRMLDLPDTAVRGLALRGLDGIESGDGWMATLRAIEAAGGAVAADARRYLARRGDAAAIEALLAAATSWDGEARDEAMVQLAGRRAVVRAHRGLFEQTLRAWSEEDRPVWGVAAVVHGMVDAFGVGVREVVLRAYLSARHHDVAEALRHVIVDRELLRSG
jgi:hypothetical protein